MTLNAPIIGIILLFAISLIVRVIPALITLNISAKVRDDIKSILPAAVFINLIVYCAFQEIQKAMLPAIIAVVLMLMAFRKVGLITTVVLGTVVYLGLDYYL